MKRFIYAFLFIGLLVWSWWTWQQKDNATPLPQLTPLPSPTESLLGLAKNEQGLHGFEVSGVSYRMVWHVVSPSVKVYMGVNTDLASSSSQIFDKQQCRILTSGGFYTTEGKPIGLLIVDGKQVSPWQQNQLFTGVLGGDGEKFSILMGDVTNQNFDWAVQAGPVVWLNQQVTKLSLKNDQAARRVLAGITIDGSLVLMAVVAGDSLFGGPFLADVGSLIPTISGIIGKQFEAVINLDGGTASALLSEAISLRELKPIGSYVCVK